MNTDIFRYINTTYDLKSMHSAVELLMEHIYDAHFSSLPLTIEKYIDPTMQRVFKDYLHTEEINPKDKEEIAYMLTQMKVTLEEKNIIKIIIAFEPHSMFMKNLAVIVKETFGITTVIEIETDKTIIGGLILVHHGIYHNYSLSKTIDEFFDRQKSTIEQSI